MQVQAGGSDDGREAAGDVPSQAGLIPTPDHQVRGNALHKPWQGPQGRADGFPLPQQLESARGLWPGRLNGSH